MGAVKCNVRTQMSHMTNLSHMCVLKIVSSVILVFWRTLKYCELEYISIFSWSKFLASINEKWLKSEEYVRNILAIFHLFIWEQFCVQLWEFHLRISKKKGKVKKVKIKTTQSDFWYADILRTTNFLLLKSDFFETVSSFKGWKRENKDDANDFSKAATFQLDSPY